MWKLLGGIFLGWGLGANDAANIFGTGVAARLISYWKAVTLISIFVIIGALIEGPKCMKTVGDLALLDGIGAFCATTSAAITLTILTYFALPASASHAIIGAILGVGLLYGSALFGKLTKIIICWIFTPIGAIIISIMLHKIIGFILDNFIKNMLLRDKLIKWAFVLAGCYGAYSLGANNVANTTGVYAGAGIITPLQASAMGSLSIALGVLTYSKKVMETIGLKITTMDSFSAFIAALSGAITVHIFTQIGVPVSTSQAAVGAVIGVGLLKGVKTVSFSSVRNIFLGWFATPALGCGLSMILLKILK